MVTALRSGPPPIPPAQPGRAADAARLPDFARGSSRLDRPAGTNRIEAGRLEPPEAFPRVAAPEPAESLRGARPARPGSILDIRV